MFGVIVFKWLSIFLLVLELWHQKKFHCKEIIFHIWIYVFCDDGWGDLGSGRWSRSFNGGLCWIWGKVSVFSGQVKQSSSCFPWLWASQRDWRSSSLPSVHQRHRIHYTRCLIRGRLGIAPSSLFSLHLSSLQNDDSGILSSRTSRQRHSRVSAPRAPGRSFSFACCFIKVMN